MPSPVAETDRHIAEPEHSRLDRGARTDVPPAGLIALVPAECRAAGQGAVSGYFGPLAVFRRGGCFGKRGHRQVRASHHFDRFPYRLVPATCVLPSKPMLPGVMHIDSRRTSGKTCIYMVYLPRLDGR